MRYPLLLSAVLVFVAFILPACFIGAGMDGTPGTSPVSAAVSVIVPAGGNSWVVDSPERNGDMISAAGIGNWADAGLRIRTYFRLGQAGPLRLALRARVPAGAARLRYTIGATTGEVALTNADWQVIPIGDVTVDRPGYQWLELQGLSRTGPVFAEVSDIRLGGPAAAGTVRFIRDEFYWGRRGPSVHLWYERPAAAADVRWFYNEVTVPEGNDVTGSYFAAIGFGEGYFGIQVNSPEERRILFSVWSPYQTDDPAAIPAADRVRLLRQGAGVHVGEFGNEGSGGQSYRLYRWRAGVTYRFLVRGEPAGNGATDYTAWFFAPELGKWELIAAFRRPRTSTYLTGLYSFLENFIPDTGPVTRQAYYGNHWVCDTAGRWHEVTRITYTADNTARKEARLDFAGGVEGDRFFLKNCGFFDHTVAPDQPFTRVATGRRPVVDLERLP